ncbi:MAG: SMI1/KNR4 family protein [Lentisphaeraceae bacterium]|nr:SMI1/KNR4 family protein [Lentisphaeraceae bacterium]
MNNYDKIDSIISKNNLGRKGIGCSDEDLIKAETQLGFTFPNSFKWFQKNYNIKGLPNGDILFGITEPEIVGNIVEYNQNLKELGYSNPDRLLIYMGNEMFYHFMLDKSLDQEFTICYSEAGMEEDYADSYSAFLLQKLSELYPNKNEHYRTKRSTE